MATQADILRDSRMGSDDYGTCRTLLSQYDPQVLNQYKNQMSQGINNFFLLSYCLACCWPGFNAGKKLRVVQKWPVVEFNFPSPEAEKAARDNHFYVPGSATPIDVDVDYRLGGQNRIFVTFPRFSGGVPVTLGTLDQNGRITGYPNYSWHDNQGHNCNGLTSVFRVAVDQCRRMWVMDAGQIGEQQKCPPKLLAFNLDTDQVVFQHVLDSKNYIGTSAFITPVVDVRSSTPGDCSDTYVYVADVTGFGILVVDVARNRSWRVTHRHFFPYPPKGVFTINGVSFDMMDGLFGLALSPYRGPNDDRRLYFHALASTKENYVDTSVIRGASEHPVLDSNVVHVLPGERPNQSASEAMDRDGILYYGLMEPPSIWCWNTATEFSQLNVHPVAVDRNALEFAAGVKVLNNRDGEQELWIVTNRLQKVWTGSLNLNETNFRIHTEKLSTLMANSPCKILPKKTNSGLPSNFV